MLLQEVVHKLHLKTTYNIQFASTKLGYFIGQGDAASAKMVLAAVASSQSSCFNIFTDLHALLFSYREIKVVTFSLVATLMN